MKNNKKYVKCIYCKEKFLSITGKAKFCSTFCMGRYRRRMGNANFLKLRFKVFERDNFTCRYCGRSVKEDNIKINTDHIIPINKDGEDTMNNIVTSCEECNLGKGDALLKKRFEVYKEDGKMQCL